MGGSSGVRERGTLGHGEKREAPCRQKEGVDICPLHDENEGQIVLRNRSSQQDRVTTINAKGAVV